MCHTEVLFEVSFRDQIFELNFVSFALVYSGFKVSLCTQRKDCLIETISFKTTSIKLSMQNNDNVFYYIRLKILSCDDLDVKDR